MLEVVRPFATKIQNGRTATDIVRHMRREMVELTNEIKGVGDGNDGVVGEAVDVIACALDLILHERPEITTEELDALLNRKCEKWARRYSDSVEGDRSID